MCNSIYPGMSLYFFVHSPVKSEVARRRVKTMFYKEPNCSVQAAALPPLQSQAHASILHPLCGMAHKGGRICLHVMVKLPAKRNALDSSSYTTAHWFKTANLVRGALRLPFHYPFNDPPNSHYLSQLVWLLNVNFCKLILILE